MAYPDPTAFANRHLDRIQFTAWLAEVKRDNLIVRARNVRRRKQWNKVDHAALTLENRS